MGREGPEDTRGAKGSLEERLDALERRVDDYSLKSEILSDVTPSFDTGLDRFFAEPEFWENTYDAAQAAVVRAVAPKQYAEHLRICDDPIQTPREEQAACRTQARATVVACHMSCAG